MTKPKVHIYRPVDETGISHKRLQDKGINLVLAEDSLEEGMNKSEKIEQMFSPDTVAAAGVAMQSLKVTRKSLESAPQLRTVVKYTVGYDNVDTDAATEMGILVVHSPTESNWAGVAEGTMANMLTLLKKVRERDSHVKNGGWRSPDLWGTFIGSRQIDNYGGITIGIIGLGRIGSRFADLLGPWRANILAFDPYVDEAKFVHHNAKSTDLETLLKESDVISLHSDLNKETHNLIGKEQLALMKPSAILLNGARGPMVDIDALFDSLDRNEISGAALDVLPDEPPDPQSPILGLGDKILLSPHMITANKGLGLRMAIPWVEEAILSALRGEVPRHVANKESIPKWLERFGGVNLL